MKLTAFKYGATEITEDMAFQMGNKETKLPVSLLFFLIECNDKKILVDVGCDTMPGFELFEFKKPVEVLESYGVNRVDITDVIITHAHHDHMDAIRYYPNAEVYIQRNELCKAERFLAGCSNVVHPVDESDFVADNVEFKHIGGHTAGSGIVIIKADDKQYVLCGDECYTKENLLHKKPTGSSYSLEKSKMFVEEYSKDRYIPILFHDAYMLADIGYKTLMEI